MQTLGLSDSTPRVWPKSKWVFYVLAVAESVGLIIGLVAPRKLFT
jgi:hypothetical protein